MDDVILAIQRLKIKLDLYRWFFAFSVAGSSTRYLPIQPIWLGLILTAAILFVMIWSAAAALRCAYLLWKNWRAGLGARLVVTGAARTDKNQG